MTRYEELIAKKDTVLDGNGRPCHSWTVLDTDELLEVLDLAPSWDVPEDADCRTPFDVLCYRMGIDSSDYESPDDLFDVLKSNGNPYRVLRAKLGLTQAKMSEVTGIPKRNIENWETGSRTPPDWLLPMLEYALKEGYKA